MNKFLALLILCFALLVSSCSKKQKHADQVIKAQEIYHLAQEHKLQESKEASDGINYKNYAIGVNPYTSKVYVLDAIAFYAIEFPNEESARREAKRLNQFYVKNWLFDRVDQEEVLEKFVQEVFKAKRP